MLDLEVRALARRRVANGETTVAVARDLGIGQSTVSRWSRRTFASDASPTHCWVCRCSPAAPEQRLAYAYLLGQYLGDGHLVTRARVPVLRVYCTTDYPAVMTEVTDAIIAVRGAQPNTLRAAHTDRMIKVQSYWKHWPCVLPQHGPGRKHERPIVLADWQREIVAEHPWPLIRGLI